ncbi:MAG: 3-hydroxyacyl-ACP dehydratase FabZ family protein [Flavobacteriaceae bacterium]
MNYRSIIERLPYDKPFLFVDDIHEASEEGVRGSFTFREELDFYNGHFKDTPVTPGVILTECCAQIGLACFALFLINTSEDHTIMALSSSEMEFYQPVYPGERVEVISSKIYFRFGKLKCEVKMYNSDKVLVCKGHLSGMLKPVADE